MKSGQGSCRWKRTRVGLTISTSLTFSRRSLAPLARWKLNFTSSALIGAHRPRLGQAGRLHVAGHRLHQRIVEAVEDPEGRELTDHLARVEPHGRERDVEGPPHLALRLRLGAGRVDESTGEHDQRHERHRYDPPPSLAHPRSSLTTQTLARLTQPTRILGGARPLS